MSDSLPDRFGNALINAWLVANGRTVESFNVIEKLCYIGTRGMGALEFFPDIERDFNESEALEISRLVDISNEILSERESVSVSEHKGYYYFMTKRFDRMVREDGSVDKVHMQTLGSLMHRDYNEPGTMSYEEVTQAMYKMGLKVSENIQFFRRMVFNVMARNQDDHVKNISFVMNRAGEWRLSPAYDVTYSFNPDGRWTAVHQMLVNGKLRDIEKKDLLQSAHAMRIKETTALEIIDDVQLALEQWSEFARVAHLDDNTANSVQKNFIRY